VKDRVVFAAWACFPFVFLYLRIHSHIRIFALAKPLALEFNVLDSVVGFCYCLGIKPALPFSAPKGELTLRRINRWLAPAGFLLLLFPTALRAGTITLDFEGFPDSTSLTNQYPGVTFTDAIILTAGISLNEFEFPPYSGVNVASDNNGPMTLTFAGTITSFSGYFTYAEPLTVDAFGATNNLVASATSAFSNNEALSGDTGSSPNEFIQVSFAGGIDSVTITGDPAGSSFTIDNATYTTGGGSVPEPATFLLLLGGLAILSRFAR
jgi:hypothetical protein